MVSIQNHGTFVSQPTMPKMMAAMAPADTPKKTLTVTTSAKNEIQPLNLSNIWSGYQLAFSQTDVLPKPLFLRKSQADHARIAT